MTSSSQGSLTQPQGLVDLPGYDLPGVVLRSWDAFIALVDEADLSASTRLRGWTVREVAVHLGTWEGQSPLTLAVESLDAAGNSEPADPDTFNAGVVAAQVGATDDEVRGALRASRDASASFFESGSAREHGKRHVASVLGPMPLLTLVHSGCYELAVHALDVAGTTGAAVDPRLLADGVAALADSVGGLAARSGIATTVQIVDGAAGWAFTSSDNGAWTMRSITEKSAGPALSGSAKDILEAASGRADAPLLLARRRLHVSEPGGLLVLAPIIDQVPGVAGARALKAAARGLSGVGSLLGHFRRGRS